MSDIAADVRTEAPPGSQDGPQLTINFILNGVPRSAMPNDGANEGADKRVPFATVKISHKVTAEEARALGELFRYAVAFTIETDDGTGKTHIQPFAIARQEAR